MKFKFRFKVSRMCYLCLLLKVRDRYCVMIIISLRRLRDVLLQLRKKINCNTYRTRKFLCAKMESYNL